MAKPQDHQSRNCKILSIVWYKVLPARYGGQKAVAKFNEHLAAFVPLLCLCSKNNEPKGTPYQVDNRLPVGKSQFINPFVWWTIYRCAKANSVTHIVLEFPYHGIAAFLCRKILGVRCILNTHNLEYLRFKDLGKWWWKPLFYYESWVMRWCDLHFFKTENDRELAVSNFSLDQNKTAVVPYGIDDHPVAENARQMIQQKHSISSDEKILLFAGTLDYQPNAQALLDIDQILIPLLTQLNFAFKVVVCGRNHLPAFNYLKQIKNPSIVFAGEVNGIENYFAAADVFIDPVRMGGGIQTKIMDALSYHVNVVAFQSKAKGVLAADEKLVTVADDDWKNFAGAVREATNRKSSTPATFFNTYNWRSIAAEAYKKICSV